VVGGRIGSCLGPYGKFLGVNKAAKWGRGPDRANRNRFDRVTRAGSELKEEHLK
jgi:hypothetical protein